MLPIRNLSYLSPMCYNFRETCTNRHKIGLVNSTPLKKVHFGVSLQIDKGVSAQLFIRVAVQILLVLGVMGQAKVSRRAVFNINNLFDSF